MPETQKQTCRYQLFSFSFHRRLAIRSGPQSSSTRESPLPSSPQDRQHQAISDSGQIFATAPQPPECFGKPVFPLPCVRHRSHPPQFRQTFLQVSVQKGNFVQKIVFLHILTRFTTKNYYYFSVQSVKSGRNGSESFFPIPVDISKQPVHATGNLPVGNRIIP